MKILSIDYGDKKIGLAISDEKEKLASRFLTVENISLKNSAGEISKIAADNKIGKIVIGIPVGFKGESGQAGKTRLFINKLKQKINLPIVEINEVFTSKMAEKNLRSAGIRNTELKNLIDQEAARIILQEYSYKINKNNENRQADKSLN